MRSEIPSPSKSKNMENGSDAWLLIAVVEKNAAIDRAMIDVFIVLELIGQLLNSCLSIVLHADVGSDPIPTFVFGQSLRI